MLEGYKTAAAGRASFYQEHLEELQDRMVKGRKAFVLQKETYKDMYIQAVDIDLWMDLPSYLMLDLSEAFHDCHLGSG